MAAEYEECSTDLEKQIALFSNRQRNTGRYPRLPAFTLNATLDFSSL